VTGGAGHTWASYPSGFCNFGPPVVCGTQPSGAPFVVGGPLVVACSRLSQSSHAIALGGTWTLDWDPSAPGCLPSGGGCGGACTAILFLSLAPPIDPLPFGGGWVFLDPSALRFVAAFPDDLPFQLGLSVPPARALIGLPVSAQVVLADGALSGPTSGLLVP
jgi:hypothetical protein